MSAAEQHFNNIESHPHEHYQTHIIRRIFSAEQEDDPTVFIAYYDEDSLEYAQRILIWFALRYGAGNVHNTGDIPPFVDSPEYYLRGKLRNSDLLVVIIGPMWERMLNDLGNDIMRIAVRIALEEHKPVVPICVKGAPPPREIDLPHDMRRMLDAKVISLDDGGFEDDMRRALAQVSRHVDTERISEPIDEFEDVYERFWAAYDNRRWLEALELLDASSDITR